MNLSLSSIEKTRRDDAHILNEFWSSNCAMKTWLTWLSTRSIRDEPTQRRSQTSELNRRDYKTNTHRPLTQRIAMSEDSAGGAIPYHRVINRIEKQLCDQKRARETISRANSKRIRIVEPEQDCMLDEQNGKWLSYGELQTLNDSKSVQPLSSLVRDRIKRSIATKYSDDEIDRKACAVTDTWVFRCNAQCLHIEELPLAAMEILLRPRKWTTSAVQEYYDCSAVDGRLRGMLLSTRGLVQTAAGVAMWISKNALQTLVATAKKMGQHGFNAANCPPPRFAIADCFVAGRYSEVDIATSIERQACGIVQTRGVVKVIYGGPGNMLQSHLLCWDNRDATIASSIPSVPREENFQVVLAGPLTANQEAAIGKMHECNAERVLQLHSLLKRINPLYQNVAENEAFSNVTVSVVTSVQATEATNDLVTQARARQRSVAQPNTTGNPEHETTVVESQTVLIETRVDAEEEARLDRALASIGGNEPTYIARRSTSFLRQDDENYLERLAPHLFTFGIGGLKSPRMNRYSRRDIVLHYLNLSTSRFAEDPMFKLQMFDYLATMEVKNGVFVRVRHDPAIALKAMNVTPDQLRRTMESQKKKRTAARVEQQFVQSQEDRDAMSVVKSMTASTSKMWGSNEERDVFQRKVDAMTIAYGQPSVFWTLTPNPDASIAVAFWSSEDLPGGRPDDLASCCTMNMPCTSKMSKLVMQNTVIQAHYYKLCCRILIEELFGWDMEADKPKREAGIFGHVEAFFFALEQQGRLRVHHHGVAWIAGMPKTQSDWKQVLASPDSRADFEKYCASIFSANLPVFEALLDVQCPTPSCNGLLTSMPIPLKYKHWLNGGTPPPVIATCGVCSGQFTDAQVASSVIEREWSKLDEEHRAVSTDAAVHEIRLRFGGLSRDKATANVQLSRLLLMDQLHAYEHTRSCVKGRAGTKCRYNFFRPREDKTALTENDEMVYRRLLGNQWLNTYVSLWREVLHFNMDARILWSGHCLQAIRYAMQYASKAQTILDNVSIVELALQRRVQRELATSTDKSEFQQGVGRLLSLAFASSGVMEIGGPLATTILVEGSAARFSCKFEILALVEALNILNNEDVEATVVLHGDQLVATTSVSKYTSRPKCLEHYSWFDYCTWFTRKSTVQTPTTDCCFKPTDEASLQKHLHHHGITKSAYPHVPEIIGPRMPDARNLDDPECSDKAELYCRVALALHCPFRNPKTFLDSSNSAKTSFEAWQATSTPANRRSLDYHQQYYYGLDEAEKYREEQDDDDSSETLDDPDVQDRSRSIQDARARPDALIAVPNDLFDPANVENGQVADGDMSLEASELAATISSVLQDNITNNVYPDDDVERLRTETVPISLKDMTSFQDQLSQSHVSARDNDAATTDERDTTRVTVELLDKAVQDLRFQPEAIATEIPNFPTILQVSRHHTLNELQHVAFVHLAVPLLHKIASVPLPTSGPVHFDNSPLIVTGPGGAGKSRIVEAVKTLAAKWSRPNSIAVVASTGIAAASLGGSTIHSSIGLRINQTHLPKHLSQPGQDLIHKWDCVLCVMADELSMSDLTLFGLWEEALRNVKENQVEAFGGLIMALMFDHCQLLPVRGHPLFKTPDHNKPFNSAQERGAREYRAITKVVYLHENMRFAEDPQWGDWLRQARLGNWTQPMKSFLKAVVAPPHTQAPDLLQVVSTDNAFRKRINDTAAKIALTSLPASRKVYAIPARVSNSTTTADLAALRLLPDNRTGNIPVLLSAYIGMPVRIKANQCVRKGVANGASADIYHIEWPVNTTFSRSSTGLYTPSNPPSNLFVRITSSTNDVRFPGLPEHWPLSVVPICQASASFKIDTRSSHSTTIKGYPIIPAFGTTVHGIQGETRNRIVISDLHPPTMRTVDRHALYVALSRVRTRTGLYWIGAKLTDASFDYFQPTHAVLHENERLQLLADRTVARFL